MTASRAFEIEDKIIDGVRRGDDFKNILDYVCAALGGKYQATGCVVWLVHGDCLTLTSEWIAPGGANLQKSALGTVFDSMQSMGLVLSFLQNFPDESATGIIAVGDCANDSSGLMTGPMLDLLKDNGTSSVLAVQLRSRGIFSGFIQLQFGQKDRPWAADELADLTRLGRLLSTYTQLEFDVLKASAQYYDQKLFYELTRLFSPLEGDLKPDRKWSDAARLIAQRCGFDKCRIYLEGPEKSAENNSLELRCEYSTGSENEAVSGKMEKAIDLSSFEHPLVEVFKAGRIKVANSTQMAARSLKNQAFFGSAMAVLVPLKRSMALEGESIGVLVMWNRSEGRGDLVIQSQDTAALIGEHLWAFARA